jgi:hypothetical protein
MAAVARRLLLRSSVGERLLTSKLQILNGTGTRRPSFALGLLTGRPEHLLYIAPPSIEDVAPSAVPMETVVVPAINHRRYSARTVYLSERHLRDVDQLIKAWQQVGSRRLTRSAVLRRAIEHVRAVVEADPAKSKLENE